MISQLKINLCENKEKDEGFSLLELVVVVAVLAVISAIALPSFTCFQKKAKATAALSALRQINSECAYKINMGQTEIFTSNSLDGYSIQTSGSNSCDGAKGTGIIKAAPTDRNELPTFNLVVDTGALTYTFKGKTGRNFSDCFGLICDTSDTGFSTIGLSSIELQAKLESTNLVMEDSFVERGCSAYALVQGSSWEKAQENAEKLGVI